MTNDPEKKAEPKKEEPDPSAYNNGQFDFDAEKDLNLPANYDEVVARFKRLQGEKAMESLN